MWVILSYVILKLDMQSEFLSGPLDGVEGKVDSTITEAQQLAERILQNVEKVMVGKSEAVRLAVIALISRGHLLIEDAPGVGKTMLARSLAKSLDCTFRRIQFTPDMLPGDITGVSVYNQKIQDFEFRPGPIMAQMVLADENNHQICASSIDCRGSQILIQQGKTLFKLELKEILKHYNLM